MGKLTEAEGYFELGMHAEAWAATEEFEPIDRVDPLTLDRGAAGEPGGWVKGAKTALQKTANAERKWTEESKTQSKKITVKYLIAILSLTLLAFHGRGDCQAKPSDFKEFQGNYIGSFTNGVGSAIPPPPITPYLPNRFFTRIPLGKGTARGGFGVSANPAQTVLYVLKQKIKKASVRQGGNKAILTGRSTVRPNLSNLAPKYTGRFRAVLRKRSQVVTYESKLNVTRQPSIGRLKGKFKARK